MARSKFKGPFIHPSIELLPQKKNLLFSKSAMILPEYVDHLFKIHNGKKFISLKILESMVGRRFGEFIYTRVSYHYKKKKKKKK